jgi:Zn-dependent protease with chaperone function
VSRVTGNPVPVAVPEPSETALQYYRGNNWLWVINRVWALFLTGTLAFSGASARLRSLAQCLARSACRWTIEPIAVFRSTRGPADSRTRPRWRSLAQRLDPTWFFTIGFYVILYLALVFLLDLPLAFYQGYLRQHAYNLSNQTFGKWFGDSLIRLAVAMVVGFAFSWVPYLLLARSPRRWWLYTAILSVPFLFGTLLVEPIWIDPLFNKFGPMKNEALERSILELAERAGISGGRVFEVDKSVDTKAVNAYVTGVLDSKRIVLWDTLIARLHKPELLFVMGHEMGHYVMGHVVRSILLAPLLVLGGLFLVDRLGRWLIARFSDRLGFDRLSDVASLPLLLMLLEVSVLLFSPLALAYSRYQEHAADRFALELTRANHAGAMSFVRMQAENLSNPRPGLFYTIFRATHPSIGERIEFCNTYHPWLEGPETSQSIPGN